MFRLQLIVPFLMFPSFLLPSLLTLISDLTMRPDSTEKYKTRHWKQLSTCRTQPRLSRSCDYTASLESECTLLPALPRFSRDVKVISTRVYSCSTLVQRERRRILVNTISRPSQPIDVMDHIHRPFWMVVLCLHLPPIAGRVVEAGS